MLGAIVGDVVGEPWEGATGRRLEALAGDFPLFPLGQRGARITDDTVLTVCVARVLLEKTTPTPGDFEEAYRDGYRRYPVAGYGGLFKKWARGSLSGPYRSYGNGGAMRVSPVGWICDSLEETLALATTSAEPTHGHPEGIRGGRGIAGAVFLARTGHSKDEIRAFAQEMGYALEVDQERLHHRRWFATSAVTVPAALVSFLEGESFEDVLRRAVRLGGDTDTMAAMAGAIAEPFFGGVPRDLLRVAVSGLDPWLEEVAMAFVQRHVKPRGFYGEEEQTE